MVKKVTLQNHPNRGFHSTCRSSSTRKHPKAHQVNPNTALRRFLHSAQQTQPSEPILFPKLRICFADFPYLHFSNDQRLFTLETCCGYGYGLARKSYSLTWIFKGRLECTGHHKSRGALRCLCPYLRMNRFQGLDTLTRKDNSPQDSSRRLQARLRYRLCDRSHSFRV